MSKVTESGPARTKVSGKGRKYPIFKLRQDLTLHLHGPDSEFLACLTLFLVRGWCPYLKVWYFSS